MNECQMTSGAKEILKTNEVEIFSNPFRNGNIGIVFSSNLEQKVSVTIFDLLGTKVWEARYLEAIGNQIDVDTRNFPLGFFFIKIAVNDLVFTKNLILAP